ncbi:hypothetical protein VNO78_21259 [Psophocarpus tetragonolobus]|uniref:Uncharacterized protein n=1 Tax=Psophocarpus tetragonolobus TaxID=3891 RepID=A0AAN9XI09_PSOTE
MANPSLISSPKDPQSSNRTKPRRIGSTSFRGGFRFPVSGSGSQRIHRVCLITSPYSKMARNGLGVEGGIKDVDSIG